MTRFVGGPADGVTLSLGRSPLSLGRSPLYLRVVQDGAEFDALDQLDDEPRAGETMTVYRRDGEPTTVHVLYSGRRDGKRGEWLRVWTYTVLEHQPEDPVMRNADTWRQWCTAQALEYIEEVTCPPKR